MAYRFFDTSALKHRYTGGTDSAKISRVVSNGKNRCYIADLTILEMPSALGGHCRAQNRSTREYDLMDHRFLSDIADGRLVVRPTNQISIVRARNLLRFAGIVKRRNLGSADALIASCCLDLAHELRKRVLFYTADWTLYSTLREVDAFRSAMTLQYILPPRAGIPART